MSHIASAPSRGTGEQVWDVVVVGSGPGGSTAVAELTARGLHVLLLEAGRATTPADFEAGEPKAPSVMGLDLLPRARAMAAGQVVQARRPFFSESSNRFLVNDLQEPYSTPWDSPYLWIRSKLLGGRMHSYGRVLQRMSDLDFRAASLDGLGDDWPIDYAELSPWYERVERAVGVFGDADGLTHPPDGVYAGPGHLTTVERDFRDRVAADSPERRVISWRVQAPFLERVPPGIVAARATGLLTERCGAQVVRVTTDATTGRADGVVYVDRAERREVVVRARAVVLAASAIETVRLLLASGSTRCPEGLGGSSGLLGRYVMDQTIAMGFFDSPRHREPEAPPTNMPADPFYGVYGGMLVPRFDNLDGGRSAGFARGVSFQGMGGRIPVPGETPAPLGLGAFGEMLARPDNRVRLHPRRRDRWGMPLPRIELSMGENDRALQRRSMTLLREMAQAGDYRVSFIGSAQGLDSRRIWPDLSPWQRAVFRQGVKLSLVLGAAIHECGGARMGSDPATSVADPRQRLWDAPNVVLADASLFVSGSTVGPALSIMALAARGASLLADDLGAPAAAQG